MVQTPHFWLHVHPDYLVGPGAWDLVRLAAQWREGRLPGPGGVQDQAAFTQAAIDIIHATWSKLEAWRRDKDKD